MSETEFKSEEVKLVAAVEAQHAELPVVAWAKKHSAQIVGAAVFVSTLVAVALLTHR